MPELTIEELSVLFAWIVDAQAFLPLSEAAKLTVDKLIVYQEKLKEKQAPAEMDKTLTNAQEVAQFWTRQKEASDRIFMQAPEPTTVLPE